LERYLVAQFLPLTNTKYDEKPAFDPARLVFPEGGEKSKFLRSKRKAFIVL
jgi:hypothetical protein